MWQGILDGVSSVTGIIGQGILDRVLWLKDRISEGWTWITDQVSAKVDWLRDRVGELTAAVQAALTEKLGWLRDRISEGWAWIVDQVLGKVDWLRERVVEVGAGISQGLQERVSWLHDRAGELWASVSQGVIDRTSWLHDRLSEGLTWVGEQLTALGGNIIASFVRAFDDAASTIIGGIVKPLQDFASWLWEAIASGARTVAGFLSEKVISPIADGLRGLGDFIMKGLGGILEAAMGIFSKPLGTPGPEAIGTVSTVVGRLMGFGVSMAVPIIAGELVHPLKNMGLGQVSAMLYDMSGFGRIAGALTYEIAYNSYILPLRQDMKAMFTPEIPESVDLIRFVVREVIPVDEFKAAMLRHGYSEHWAAAYWQAHWVLPPLNSVYEAFHRGTVDEAFVRSFLVLADYEAKYHDLLLSTIYTLIPRVDLRYGWEVGALSDEDLYGLLRKQGFDDAGATAEVTIQKRRVLESELNTMRGEAVSDYVDGFITQEQLASNLAATGLRPELVAYRVAAAVLRRQRAERKEQVTSYKTLYLKGGYTVSEAIGDLKAIGVTQEEAVSTLQAWEVLRKPARVVETRGPEDDVQDQLTLNERYHEVIIGTVKDLEKEGADVTQAKGLIGQGELWQLRAGEELKARRISVAMDMARYAEAVIKSADTSLRRIIVGS
jgi:hypothetical protein